MKFRFDFRRKLPRPVPLDIAFVLDTTGSMGDEIQKLKQTIEYINFQITHFEPRPDVRFGMVLYRDRGDDYRTRLVPFTGDFSKFVDVLSSVRAGGGGDTPEDVQEALRQAMWSLKWRTSGVKLAFLIGDAPPHLDYGQRTTYVDSMRRAAELGVKIAAIGASGLDLQGELVWRQIAQYTMAPFVFLTYGETGDSEGSPSTVSHHVGNNWVAENLDAIIVRMVKIELSHYGDRPVVAGEDYFTADSSPSQAAGQVLEELFRQAVRQLIDYCVQRIDPSTPTVVLPPVAAKEVSSLAEKAGRKLLDRLSLGLVQSGRFQLVEKADQPKVLEQLKEQFGSKYDESKVAELGRLVPARLAVFSRLDPGEKGRVEMLIKLVRLETGEILSLSLLKIDRKLLGQ
ncbi:MAG: VWA domain-containing protein [Deltaproteobacteria bacterium]|nr:MAG: VWA domain-containing protein [Deltaproteobacteria bacterium]